MSNKNHDWIVGQFISLNAQIKEETGIDLLRKSPQALAMLCLADVLSGVCASLEGMRLAIGYPHHGD